MKTLTVKFVPGDKVVIPALENCPAVVTVVRMGMSGVALYDVAWFHDGRRETDLLFEHELEGA